MSLLRMHNLVVSLDGFATGDEQTTDAAFGHAQDEFLHWFGKIRIWRGLQPDGNFGPDEAVAAAWGSGIGAEIMGRNKFRPTRGPWPDDGWRGWWGEEPPFRAPCFVMTHYPRDPMQVGETTFHFVSETPAEVLALAQEAAGGLDVRLGGGPTTVNDFLAPTSSTTCTSSWCRWCSAAGYASGTGLAACTTGSTSRRRRCRAALCTCSSLGRRRHDHAPPSSPCPRGLRHPQPGRMRRNER